MKQGPFELPKRLPVLPLRDLVLFPGITLPLFVGRPRSVAAMESVLDDGGLFLAVTQRRPDLVEPTGRDLHRVGTIACIREHSRLPDGTMRVVVCGLFRSKLKRLSVQREFLEGALAGFPDAEPVDEEESEIETLRDEVLGLFEEYVTLRDRLTPEVFETSRKLHDPSSFTLFVAGHVAAGMSTRQKLLAAEGWLERLRLIFELLDADVRVLRLERRGRQRATEVRAALAPDRPRREARRPGLTESAGDDEDDVVRGGAEQR